MRYIVIGISPTKTITSRCSTASVALVVAREYEEAGYEVRVTTHAGEPVSHAELVLLAAKKG